MGVAHLKTSVRLFGNGRDMAGTPRGRQRTMFGGTGLKLAYAFADQGAQVTFVTSFANTGVNSLIADSMASVGIAVRAEFHDRLPESGEVVVEAEDGTVLARSMAGGADTVVLRGTMVSQLVDGADLVVIECALHQATMIAAIGRAARQEKSCWLVANDLAAVERLAGTPGFVVSGVFLCHQAGGAGDATAAAPNEAPHTHAPGAAGQLKVPVVIVEPYAVTLWRPGDEEPAFAYADRAMPQPLSGDIFEEFVTTVALRATGNGLAGAVRSVVFEAAAGAFGDSGIDPFEHRLALLRTDSLTGLTKKDMLPGVLARLDASRPVALVVFDIDHFKKVNDTFGHATGDTVLKIVGGLLLAQLRQGDHAIRYGGEELIVLLPDTSLDDALAVAERVRTAVEDHPFDHGALTCSGGVAVGMPADFDQLFKNADQALYQSKHSGRNRITPWQGGA
jgi:diguanylate cyclase (GGDEF)-like protein